MTKFLAIIRRGSLSEHTLFRLLTLIVCVFYLALALHIAWLWAPTHDEYWHLPYGLYYWQTGNLYADPINPPLLRMWAALPLYLAGYRLPLEQLSSQPTPYEIGDLFLQRPENEYRQLYFMGRVMNLALGLLGALFLIIISRQYLSPLAAYAALCLWGCCPNLLAHSCVVTHDLGLAVAVLNFLYTFYLWWNHPSWIRIIRCGIILGLAQMTKLTAILLYPLSLVLLMIATIQKLYSSLSDRDTFKSQIVNSFTQYACGILVSWISVWVCYGACSLPRLWAPCMYPSSHHAESNSQPSNTAEILHAKGLVIAQPPTASRHQALTTILPTPYVMAWRRLRQDLTNPHPVYLHGEWRRQGFMTYYLYAILYKAPLGTLILWLMACMLYIFHRQSAVPRMLSWLGMLCTLTFILPASISHNQIGFRYILPGYIGMLLTACTVFADHTFSIKKSKLIILLSIGALNFWSLCYHPDHLSFFNMLAGGPEKGAEHLLDSNIDWGQDLYRLRDYVVQRSVAGLKLAYFGSIPPEAVGLPSSPPPFWTPEPGWYAVSVNFLHGRPHTLRLSREYFLPVDLDAFGYFRFFQPCQRIGWTIYLYKLSGEDIQRYHSVRRQFGLE